MKAISAARFLKVDHAGEHGAVNIYAGQIWLARHTAPDMVAELRVFLDHEMSHRARFAAELVRRGERRCRSFHLCGIGGLLLGLLTGLCGRSAIAATTLAVERVVLRHLRQQLDAIGDQDPKAWQVIASIVDEECQHHDTAADSLRQGTIWSALLQPIVAMATEAVIWLGMKI